MFRISVIQKTANEKEDKVTHDVQTAFGKDFK